MSDGRHSSEKWESMRGQLNHDWLKNQFLPAIARMRNVLAGALEDDGFATAFVQRMLPEWGSQAKQMALLIATFEDAMSPCSLMDRSPLDHMPIKYKVACGLLAHRLWLSRYPVRSWVAEATAAHQTADRACTSLCSVVQRPGHDSLTVDDLESPHRACVALAQAIERFPHRVLVMESL